MLDLHIAAASIAPKTSINFGIDAQGTGRLLRAIAEKVESGEFLLQDLEAKSNATQDDFLLHHFSLTYAMRVSKEEGPAP